MTRAIFLTLVPVASLLLSACASGPADDPVEDFIASTGQTFTSCGVVELPAACGAKTAEQSKAISCFTKAECKPVRLDIMQPTAAGSPVRTTYLLVPQGGKCQIESFVDARLDSLGEVTQSSCESVEESDACPFVTANECYSACSADTDCG